MIYRLAVVLFIAFTSFLSVQFSARGILRPVHIELPARYMPGQHLPADSRCTWEYWGYLYCESHGVRMGARGGLIESASMDVQVSVGDLILAWGEPSGIERYGKSVYVYWGNRRAWMWLVGGFSPHSQAVIVTWMEDAGKPERWRGFSDR